MFQPGDMVGGHEIAAKIKSGGMATLYLARRIGAAGFSRPVAIKVVHPHLAEDETFVSMFVDEALLTSRIDHPHVVRIDELGEHEGSYYLAMEYVHGCSLSQVMRVLRRSSQRMAPELAVALAVRIADGLHVAHELHTEGGEPANVVHRDVSPSNILLGYRGEVKLIDFGVAKAAGRSHATRTGSLKGKIAYMSPEQAYGREVDRRTDIYALGIVLWEALCARRLFKGPNELAMLERVRNPETSKPSQYVSGISDALDEAVMTALHPNPDARFATCQDFRQSLIEALPSSAVVDGMQIGSVVRSVMSAAIEKDRQVLPSSMFRTLPGSDEYSNTAVSRLLKSKEEPPAAAEPADDEPPPGPPPQTATVLDPPTEAPTVEHREPRPRRRLLRWTPVAAIALVVAGLGVWFAVERAGAASEAEPSAQAPPETSAAAPAGDGEADEPAPGDAEEATSVAVASPDSDDAGRAEGETERQGETDSGEARRDSRRSERGEREARRPPRDGRHNDRARERQAAKRPDEPSPRGGGEASGDPGLIIDDLEL